MKYILGLVLFAFSSSIYSQGLKLSGSVTDNTNHQPIPLASIVVKKPNDSLFFIRAVANSDGVFWVGLPEQNVQYIISVSSIGYKKKDVTVFSNSKMQGMTIVMAPIITNLKEIVVMSKRSLIKAEVDKITYNVRADSSLKNKSSWEAMANMPFFYTKSNKELKYKDDKKYIVLLNGMKYNSFTSNLETVLKALPVHNIKRIELLPDPDVRFKDYDAVVNIVTDGYLKGNIGNMNLSNQYIGNEFNTGNSFFYYYQYNNFGIQANLIQRRESLFEENNSFTTFMDKDVVMAQHQKASINMLSKIYNGDISFNTEYKNAYTSSIYFSMGNSRVNRKLNGNFESTDQTILPNYYSETKYLQDRNIYEVGGDIIKKFKRPYTELSLSVRNNTSLPDENNDLKMISMVETQKRTRNKTSNNDFNAELSFTGMVSKILTWESALNYIKRKYSNDFTYDSLRYSDNVWETSQLYSADNNTYTQEILKYYQGFKIKRNNLLLNLGANLDASAYTSMSPQNPSANMHLSLFNFYPVINIRLKDRMITYLAKYTKQIKRPDSRLVGNYIIFFDPQNLFKGNNSITQQINHNLTARIEVLPENNKMNLYLNLDASLTPKLFYSFVLYDKTINKTITEYKNIGTSQWYTVGTGINLRYLKGVSLHIMNRVSYSIRNNKISNLITNGWFDQLFMNCSVKAQNGFTISSDLNISTTGKTFQGSVTSLPRYSVMINKEMLKHQGILTLGVSNFLVSNARQTSIINELDFYRNSQTVSPSRMIELTFSYRFGNLEVGGPIKQKRLSSDDVISK